MFRWVEVRCVMVLLAMSMAGPIRSKPTHLAHVKSHSHGGDPETSNQHPILYVQINDDGLVNRSRHQNDYTLMDIASTRNGILIKGRKTARYLCSHLNNTLYSTLMENCKFKESHANILLNDHRNTRKINLSPGEIRTNCLRSGEVNLNMADPLGMVEC